MSFLGKRFKKGYCKKGIIIFVLNIDIKYSNKQLPRGKGVGTTVYDLCVPLQSVNDVRAPIFKQSVKIVSFRN